MRFRDCAITTRLSLLVVLIPVNARHLISSFVSGLPVDDGEILARVFPLGKCCNNEAKYKSLWERWRQE